MALITPIQLQERIQSAIRQTPRLVQEAMEESNLVEINRKNLMEGKDSEGNDMPRYKSPEYAHFKTSINPKNRGFWDLRVMGEYQNFINVTIHPAVVFFNNKLNNEKTVWLHQRLGKRHLGITQDQIIKVQIDNKPKIREKILKIINGS